MTEVPNQMQFSIEEPADSKVPEVEISEKHEAVSRNVGRIVISDEERGGLSERDRLGLTIDEDNHIVQPDGIRNPQAYAESLVGSVKSLEVLAELYKKYNRSDDKVHQEVAKAMAELPRVQAALNERR